MPNASANAACSSNCSIRPGERIGALAAGAKAARSNLASISSITIPGFPGSFGLKLPASAPASIPEKAHAIDDGTVSAIRVCRRLHAIMAALEDISRQARRYARWRGKPIEERRPQRESPLRLGWPPGWRIRATHEVDDILKDCHWLVRNIPKLDTS